MLPRLGGVSRLGPLGFFAVAGLMAGCAGAGSVPSAQAERGFSSSGVRGAYGVGVTVRPKLPGTIEGFDIDQHGNDGLLASYDERSFRVSLETFDQTTGKITKVIREGPQRKGDYAVFGILARDVGFFEHGTAYDLMSPVSGNAINGSWTPPQGFEVSQIAENQNTPAQVMLGYDFGIASAPTALVVADVAKGTAKEIALDQSVFGTGAVPVIAQDPASDEAVIAAVDGGRYTHPTIGIVNLKNGKTTTFTGLGYGEVDGIGIDSKTHTACTTTGIDAGVEFYNLKTRRGFEVQLPHSEGSELRSGAGVAMDPIHGLCIIAQPVPGSTTQASQIVVADEKGEFLEEIPGFNFWFGVVPAIDPAKRTGFVQSPRPEYAALAGFSY
jgi:hypothetical protein